jgi:isoleucyl-tRNA synthetase
MDELGADILRLWVASTDYSGELSISKEILKRVVESYRRIRNTLRFLLANLDDFDASKHALPPEQWLEIDRYALELTRKFQDDVVAGYGRYEFHSVIKSLTAFCSEDLGAFYLDILKDRLYTTGADSRPRRAAQNALWHIANALIKLMAPVLSFTAEEAWQVFKRGPESSIFEEEWHVLPDARIDQRLLEGWFDIRNARDIVNKKIEEDRAKGAVGSSLQAELDLHASGPAYEMMKRLGDDLRFVFITSRATLHKRADAGDDLDPVPEVTPSPHTKCERCWHYRADVGHDANHPELCGRCTANLTGTGEPRQYA